MLFHHPEQEKSLRRMAAAVLKGKAMEPSDVRPWPRIKSFSKATGWEAVICVFTCLLAGLSIPTFREPAWRDFILAGAVMLASRQSGLRFNWLLQSSPTAVALWHLPVAGRDMCRWARQTFLAGTLKLLPRMMVTAWAWSGFPAVETAWPQIAGTGFMLWLVMLACVQHLSIASTASQLPRKIWNLALCVWACMVIYAWVGNKHAGLAHMLPSWIKQVCVPVSWVLPAQWAMHAADNATALMVTLACLAAGGLFWWRFPESLGWTYDQLTPDAQPQPQADEAEQASETHDAVTEHTAVESAQTLKSLKEAAADQRPLVQEGWIERLLFALLPERDRMLAPVLIGLEAGWTKRWLQAVKICMLLLPISYALLRLATPWIAMETLELWIVLLPSIAVVSFSFPVSNSIPLATLSWPLGQHGMPLFTGLPVSMHDLLRLSCRVTVARMIACLSLALPLTAVLCVLLNHVKAMPVILCMVVILSLCWILMRPAFIYYRLQQMSRPGRRHRLGHAFAYLLLAPLAFGMPVCVVLSGTLFQASPLFLAVSLPLTACCALAIYAVFHWRVKTHKVDWITDAPEQ
ncbi:hypothetical protein [Prosthecobacter sp.]|uniref:hypothetical protein n=1 Tax=Prosthecobacter sp. TaxID=1965333 RepID=UPI00378489F9